jgi:hypothetical protein
MRSTITISMCLWLFSQGGLGPQTAQVASAEKLPSGLRIPAILRSALSSSKSKVGDPVQLEVVVDVHNKNAAVVIPRHSKLYGRVTYVVPYEKKKQPAILSFAVDRAECKGHSVSLDAAVFGTDAMASDSQKGELVEGIMASTLRHSDSLNLISTTLMYDFRLSGNVPQALHDTGMHNVVMQLKILPDPAVRTAFIKQDGDVELHGEFLLVLLNGMKVVE